MTKWDSSAEHESFSDHDSVGRGLGAWAQYVDLSDDRLTVREGADDSGAAGFDLEERTAAFGESIIEFCQSLHSNPITAPLISQIVRSSTSIGANYCEADDAVSRREFHVKIGTCRKESRETKFWLRMIAKAAPDSRDRARTLWQEAKELHLIFSTIFRKTAG